MSFLSMLMVYVILSTVLLSRQELTRQENSYHREFYSSYCFWSADVALFETQIQLTAGGTLAQQLGLPASSLDPNFDYDPYLSSQVKQITSDRVASKTAFSIQSARQVDVGGTNYLELTVFDHTITDDAVRNEQFVTVRINAPQGGDGNFRINTSASTNSTKLPGMVSLLVSVMSKVISTQTALMSIT